MRTILTPEEALRGKLSIGSYGEDTSIRSNFKICKLEGRDGYKRGDVDITTALRVLKSLQKAYPQFNEQIQSMIMDCSEQYTFKEGINNFEEFKRELEKFYVHNDEFAKLLLDEENRADDNPYNTLYKLYIQKGADEIQGRIDRLQSATFQELFMAEDGYRFKPVEIEKPSQDIEIPHFTDIFK